MFIKKYLFDLFSSISSVNFYRNLKDTSALSTLMFFLVSFFFLGLYYSVEVISKEIPRLEKNLNQSLNSIENNYPEDLLINWDTKNLQINRELINLDYPDWLEIKQSELPKHFASYAQKDLSSNNIFPEIQNSSFFVFDINQVFISNLRGEYTALSLNETPGFKTAFMIDKSSIPEQISEAQRNVHNTLNFYKRFAVFLIVPLFMLFIFIGKLIDTLILFFFVRIFNKFSFKYIFNISLHVAVIAGLIERISSTIYANQHYPLFSISYWIILLFILWSLKKSDSERKTN